MKTHQVLWKGKMRTRIRGKPKFWNSVQWLLEEGKTPKEIRKILFNDKIPNLILRLDKEKIKGKKRNNMKSRVKYKMKEALRKVLGRKVYASEFPNDKTRS